MKLSVALERNLKPFNFERVFVILAEEKSIYPNSKKEVVGQVQYEKILEGKH